MNALKLLDSKQLVVFAGTLLLGLVSFFTLLPDSKALPINNSTGKLHKMPVFPDADAMAPDAPIKGRQTLPFLKVRPERTDLTPPGSGQNHV
ncbi:MAG: hypothetical protein U1F76_17120 [Candidatus Competibacteraceae bacterium]